MKFLFCFVLVLSSPIVLAQSEGTLSTDRPGEGTDAATVVGVNRLQIEAGFLREWERQEDDHFVLYPTALLRYGLVERVEIRIASGFFTDQDTPGTRWLPIDISTKVALVEEQRGWIPQAALLVGLTLPQTGSSSAQSSFTQPRIVVLLNHSLNSWLGITTNLGAHWEDDSPETIYRYAVSFDVSLSDRVGAFAEFYGNLPEASRDSHLFNSGFTYLITNDLQLDLAAGTALTAGVPDFYVGGGVSVRW